MSTLVRIAPKSVPASASAEDRRHAERRCGIVLRYLRGLGSRLADVEFIQPAAHAPGTNGTVPAQEPAAPPNDTGATP